MNETIFSQMVQDIFKDIQDQIDRDYPDLDCVIHGGLLEISNDTQKIVINQQAPLSEIWLAYRVGGYHFKYDGKNWVSHRDNETLQQQLLLAIEWLVNT